MKHIVFSIVLLFCCFQVKAQVAMAEIDSLYGFCRTKDIMTVESGIQNIPETGIVKWYKFNMMFYQGRSYLDSLAILNRHVDGVSAYFINAHKLYDKTIKTINSLMGKAIQKDKWEYHNSKADTMMYSLVLANAQHPIRLGDKYSFFSDASEYLTFKLTTWKDKIDSTSSFSDGFLYYACLTDPSRENPRHITFEEILQQLAPILEQPDIERRSISLSHSSDIFKASIILYPTHSYTSENKYGKGETHGIIYTMPNDEKMLETLQRIKNMLDKYTEQPADVPFTYNPDIKWLYYVSGFPNVLFSISNNNDMKLEVRVAKSETFWNNKKGNPRYILVLVTKGDLWLPLDWETIISLEDDQVKKYDY